MSNKPIFIVGAPRSGTTLLQYRLRNHPRISLPTGESHFLVPLYRNQASFTNLDQVEGVRAVLKAMYKQSQDFLETDLHGLKFDLESLARTLHAEGRRTLPSIMAGLFEKNAQGEGKVRWGDKTPYYVLHIPKLLEWFPGAQIVHLIRDGRDVALSLMGRRRDFGVYNVYHAAKYWEQYVQRGRELGHALKSDQYLELRYEDLLAAPEATLKKLCDFLGESYTDELFGLKAANPEAKDPLIYKPIRADNAGKWREAMSPRQIRVFESAAGKTLQAFGYRPQGSTSRLPLPLRAAYRFHNHLATRYWRHKEYR